MPDLLGSTSGQQHPIIEEGGDDDGDGDDSEEEAGNMNSFSKITEAAYKPFIATTFSFNYL